MTATLARVVALVEEIAPPRLQEEADRSGLAAGDPAAEVRRIVLALDATVPAVRYAAARGAGLLLCHHPPIYRPVTTLREDRPPGDVLAAAIRAGVAIYAAHTSFDSAPGGMSDYVAARVGVATTVPLSPSARDHYFKLVTFVPEDHAEAVAQAIFDAGGGVIGRYSHCAFRHPGTGSFLPLAGADPYSGTKGELSREAEHRLEVRVPRDRLSAIVAAMRAAHPYDEVAYDVHPIVGGDPWGLGRVGDLDAPTDLAAFARRVKEALALPAVRVTGDPGAFIARVAVCTGAGASVLERAAHARASVLVTGDVTYHVARDAERLGIALVDAGHFGTEAIFAAAMGPHLSRRLAAAGLAIELDPFPGERDPFALV
jgi:dinuclear metal center YbgI/SA1388 family protein